LGLFLTKEQNFIRHKLNHLCIFQLILVNTICEYPSLAYSTPISFLFSFTISEYAVNSFLLLSSLLSIKIFFFQVIPLSKLMRSIRRFLFTVSAALQNARISFPFIVPMFTMLPSQTGSGKSLSNEILFPCFSAVKASHNYSCLYISALISCI